MIDPSHRMREFRSHADLTQASLAIKLGVSVQTIRAVEIGSRKLGLAPALMLERLSMRWDDGPIMADEWVAM